MSCSHNKFKPIYIRNFKDKKYSNGPLVKLRNYMYCQECTILLEVNYKEFKFK